jgi:hypothetical protein
MVVILDPSFSYRIVKTLFGFNVPVLRVLIP